MIRATVFFTGIQSLPGEGIIFCLLKRLCMSSLSPLLPGTVNSSCFTVSDLHAFSLRRGCLVCAHSFVPLSLDKYIENDLYSNLNNCSPKPKCRKSILQKDPKVPKNWVTFALLLFVRSSPKKCQMAGAVISNQVQGKT